MKILRALYSLYTLIWFIVWFVILLPVLIVPILDNSKFRWIGVINRIWARLLFASIFMPVRITYEEELDPDGQYILCPNHFSYMDIPTVGLVKINAIFVGKSAMERIPLFGWMYKKLHITVDRKSLRSRYDTMIRCFSALDEGKSLVIFPEGGIISEGEPVLNRFKDGPFRIAIEKQIPLVPVTIYNNWIILQDDLLLRHRPIEIRVHSPIEVKGKTMADLNEIKARAFETIHKALNERFPNEYRREVV